MDLTLVPPRSAGSNAGAQTKVSGIERWPMGSAARHHAADARASLSIVKAGTKQVAGVPEHYNPAIQDARMTFGFFVQAKFIPEHVAYKTKSGQTHYRAMLKHVLRPEAVCRMFNESAAGGRLKSMDDWPYLDDIRMCDLRPDHVASLIASANSRNYSMQTITHIKNVIFAIIAHAQNEGCFKGKNPASQVKLPRIVRRRTGHLAMEQMMAALAHMQDDEKLIALLMIATDLAVNEICGLRWEDINLSSHSRQLDTGILPPWSIAVRSDSAVRLGRLRDRRRKPVEIPASLVPSLARLSSGGPGGLPHHYLLASEGGQPLNPERLKGRLKEIGRNLGLPGLTWRILRSSRDWLLSEAKNQLISTLIAAGQEPDAEVCGTSGGDRRNIESDTMADKFSCRLFPKGRSGPASPLREA